MNGPFWEFIGAVTALCMCYLAVADFIVKKHAVKQKDAVQHVKDQNELELKVKEMEGKIQVQYEELSSKLANLEKSIGDGKATNLAFETRILQSVDKLDNKMEAIRDLVIKVVTNQK